MDGIEVVFGYEVLVEDAVTAPLGIDVPISWYRRASELGVRSSQNPSSHYKKRWSLID